MTEYQKLESILCALQEVEDDCCDSGFRGDVAAISIGARVKENLDQAMTWVEEIREKYFDEDGNLIEGALDE